MDAKSHREAVYSQRTPEELSWFQPEARLSLECIRKVAPALDSTILDVGGGASTRAGGLLDAGYRGITVLDLSAAALENAKLRLGPRSASVAWREADTWPFGRYGSTSMAVFSWSSAG